MKADLLDLQGKKMRSLDLPFQFSEEVRPDLIQRAVLAIHSHNRQPYGTKPDAGMRHSSKLSRRRRQFRGSYTHGIARSPRKIMTRRGTQFFWVGATAPNTRGGRRSHPPKAGKIWAQHINVQERRKAIRSALAATLLLDIVRMRGHKVSSVPLVVESKLEALSSTKELKTTLENLNLAEELLRTKERKIRAGKGKAMQEKLSQEIMSVANNEGAAMKRKNDMHRMAEANKAFAHFARSR